MIKQNSNELNSSSNGISNIANLNEKNPIININSNLINVPLKDAAKFVIIENFDLNIVLLVNNMELLTEKQSKLLKSKNVKPLNLKKDNSSFDLTSEQNSLGLVEIDLQLTPINLNLDKIIYHKFLSLEEVFRYE